MRKEKFNPIKNKAKQLKKSNRVYTIYTNVYGSNEILIYISNGNPELNFNCVFKNNNKKEIVCRHFSHFVALKNIKNYQGSLKAEASIKKESILMNNDFDIKYNNRSSYYCLIPLSEFGNQLHQFAQSLSIDKNKTESEQLTYLLHSENHSMAISIQLKKNKIDQKLQNYVIKFYDPNSTNVHQRALCSNLEVIKKISIENFLDTEVCKAYFPKFKAIHFLKPDIRKKNSAPQIKMRHFRQSELDACLYFCLDLGIDKAIKNLVNSILNLKRTSKNKIALIRAIDADGTPGLFVAMQNGHAEVVRTYISTVLASDKIKKEEKIKLLVGKNDNGTSALGMFLENEDENPEAATASAYCSEILKLEEKLRKKIIPVSENELRVFISLLDYFAIRNDHKKTGYKYNFYGFYNRTKKVEAVKSLIKIFAYIFVLKKENHVSDLWRDLHKHKGAISQGNLGKIYIKLRPILDTYKVSNDAQSLGSSVNDRVI